MSLQGASSNAQAVSIVETDIGVEFLPAKDQSAENVTSSSSPETTEMKIDRFDFMRFVNLCGTLMRAVWYFKEGCVLL